MKWTGLAGTLAALLVAAACHAESPELSGGQMMPAPLLRGQMYSGSNWWSRFGEAVNADALASESPKGGSMPLHGDGYIYGIGSCDCPPPCIWHLWSGYVQHPKRCDPYSPLFQRRCGCGNCDACGKGCGAAVPSCSTKVGCGTPVSCTSVAGDCGCKPVCGKCRHFHIGQGWKCFTAHWHKPCNSCSAALGCGAPISCGCATPMSSPGPETQASQRPLMPLPEDAALIQLPRLN
jgi:hypothetical protein